MTVTHEEPTSPSIIWGYRRKSTLQQSYERQTKALHDVGIPAERVFEDAMSGKTMNRPGWQNLLSHVRTNDEVWVDGLDRLGRSTLATLQAMEELELRGVRVRSARPGEDLEGATGVLTPLDSGRARDLGACGGRVGSEGGLPGLGRSGQLSAQSR